MLDAAKAIRKSYFQALNGNITHNAVVIPVVEKVDIDNIPDLFVWLNGQRSTKAAIIGLFASDEDVIIDIVNVRKQTSDKSVVDSIAGQIMQIVRPTPRTIGLTIEAPFRLVLVKQIDDTTDPLVEVGGNKVWINKRLIFRNHICQ